MTPLKDEALMFAAAQTGVVDLVGPKGYIHGYIYVGGSGLPSVAQHNAELAKVSAHTHESTTHPSDEMASDREELEGHLVGVHNHDAVTNGPRMTISQLRAAHDAHHGVFKSDKAARAAGYRPPGARSPQWGRLPSDRMTSERKSQLKAERAKTGETPKQQRDRQQSEVDKLTEPQKAVYSQAHTLQGKSHAEAISAAKASPRRTASERGAQTAENLLRIQREQGTPAAQQAFLRTVQGMLGGRSSRGRTRIGHSVTGEQRAVRSEATSAAQRKAMGLAPLPSPATDRASLNPAQADRYAEARQSGRSHEQAMLAAKSGGPGGSQAQFESHLAKVKQLAIGEHSGVARGSVSRTSEGYNVTVGGKTRHYSKYADDATRALMTGRHQSSSEPVRTVQGSVGVGRVATHLESLKQGEQSRTGAAVRRGRGWDVTPSGQSTRHYTSADRAAQAINTGRHNSNSKVISGPSKQQRLNEALAAKRTEHVARTTAPSTPKMTPSERKEYEEKAASLRGPRNRRGTPTTNPQTVAGRGRQEVAGAKKLSRLDQMRALSDRQRKVYLAHRNAGMRHGPAYTRAKKA